MLRGMRAPSLSVLPSPVGLAAPAARAARMEEAPLPSSVGEVVPGPHDPEEARATMARAVGGRS